MSDESKMTLKPKGTYEESFKGDYHKRKGFKGGNEKKPANQKSGPNEMESNRRE